MTQATDTAPPPGPGAGAAKSEAMSAQLARNWWAVLLRGIAAVLFGLIALIMPGITLATLVLLFAAYMLVDGVLAIVTAVKAARRHERWGLFVIEGVFDILAGAAALLIPAAALVAFVALAAAWAIISGGLMVGSAFRLNRDHGRGWLVLGGVASVVWGALLLVFPIAGLIVLTWWLGAYALVFGVSLIVLGLSLHRRAVPHDVGTPLAA